MSAGSPPTGMRRAKSTARPIDPNCPRDGVHETANRSLLRAALVEGGPARGRDTFHALRRIRNGAGDDEIVGLRPKHEFVTTSRKRKVIAFRPHHHHLG